jgi:hypothetical protein
MEDVIATREHSTMLANLLLERDLSDYDPSFRLNLIRSKSFGVE